MSEYAPRQYSLGISIARDLIVADRRYGKVRRGGKIHYRDYGRPIKGGVSFFELIYGELPDEIPSVFGAADE